LDQVAGIFREADSFRFPVLFRLLVTGEITMVKYVLKRLLLMIPTMLAVVVIVFSIMAMTPGSPGRLILGMDAPEEAVQLMNEQLGFNRPFLVRLGSYITDMFKGSFGNSYRSGKPVFSEILPRFPNTLIISFFSVLMVAILGIPMGILSAVKQYTFIDGFTTTVALFLNAIPGFWFGMLMMLLFALKLKWLPATGDGSVKHFIMPVLTIALPGSAGVMRMTRTTMLETIRQDYIRTARAKGASEKRVIWRHALKNALLPVITSLGVSFGHMLGGTVIIENVFAVPGLGAVVLSSIRSKDIPLVMASVIFLAALFCLIMLLVDLMYGFIDPRIKAQYTK
jgi:peptide/nickel transport system permease protein